MTKRITKPLSLVLCFLMVFSAFVPVFGAPSSTDYESHWAKEAIQSAINSGVTKGYPDGSFKPDNAITRAEFITLVNNSFHFTTASASVYSDVAADAWYAPAIAKAKAAGYISGYPDGSIHPNSNITRQEAAVILSKLKSPTTTSSNTLTFTDAGMVADWSKQAVVAVFEAKMMSGYPDGSFKPSNQIKRAESLVAINNCLNYKETVSSTDTVYDKAGTYGSSSETTTIQGNVVIKAPGVTLQNTIVTGNLIIAKEVGTGDVTLKSVIVKGNTYVNGGGVNSIYFVNVTTGKVYVLKDDGPVRIVASGTSAIEEVMAGSDVKLEEVDMTGGGFEGISVEKNAAGGIDITLTGVKCESVDIQAVGVTLNTDKTSTVAKLTVDAENTKIAGTGLIANAVINAGGVNFETKPTLSTTAPGVTAPTFTPAPSAVGGGGGSPSSTVAVSSITVTGAAAVVNGLTLQMGVNLEPATATNKAVTWHVISGPGTIDENGLLTTTGVGAVSIKAVAKDGSAKEGTKAITVTDGNQASPTGLASMTPTSALTDGKITGTTTAMEYKLASAADNTYVACSATSTTVAAAGDYVVRFAAKTGFNAGTAAAVTVAAYTALNADQDAPTGLAGVAPTSALTDGKITGTTTAMEYKLASGADNTYAVCLAANTTVAAAGDFMVRFAAKTGFNAGTTAAVTVTAYTAPNADQDAPTGLAGVAPTSALTDGKITGTTTAMEYKLASEADNTYAACLAADTTVGAAGYYVVRFAAKTGFNASPTTEVRVNTYVVPHLITELTLALDAETVDISNPFITISSLVDQDGVDVLDYFLEKWDNVEAQVNIYDGSTLAVFVTGDKKLEFARIGDGGHIEDITLDEVGEFQISLECDDIESNIITITVTAQTLAQAKAAAEEALTGMVVTNDTTEADVLAEVDAVITNVDITSAFTIEFAKTDATDEIAGTITGTITLTNSFDEETDTVVVNKEIAAL